MSYNFAGFTLFSAERGLESKTITLLLLSAILLQLMYKSHHLMLVLLVFESLMLTTVLVWSLLGVSQAFLTHSILSFFLVAVSEACLGLALMIALVRQTGKESLS